MGDNEPQAGPAETNRAGETTPYGGLNPEDAVEILHPTTGQAYGVSVAAFRELYEPQGYVITRRGDGTLLPDHPDAVPAEVIPEDNPSIPQPVPETEAEDDSELEAPTFPEE